MLETSYTSSSRSKQSILHAKLAIKRLCIGAQLTPKSRSLSRYLMTPCADEWEKGLRRGDNSICQNLMRSFQDFRLHISFLDFLLQISFTGPPKVYKKKTQKNRRIPRIRPTDVFLSFMPTGVLPSTFCQAFSNFKFPAHISLSFSQTDDISIISTYRRSLEDLPKSLKQNAKEKKNLPVFF